MTTTDNSHVSPYHPGCKHRFQDQLDHNALVARLNDIADQQYKLLLLCNHLEEELNTHDGSEIAHPYIRTLIDNTNTRLASIKTSLDSDISNLRLAHNTDVATLNTVDDAINTRIAEITDELADIQGEIQRGFSDLDHPINNSVSSGNLTDANNGKVVLNSTAPAGYNMAYASNSTHGKFTSGTANAAVVVNYTVNGNTTGNPTHTAVLLNENGDASFPNTVSATTFSGKATDAVIADSARKLTSTFGIALQDNPGSNTGPVTNVDGSRAVTIKLPTTLANTNVTGYASMSYADETGANIVNTYVHKTNVDENIAGVKSFTGTAKANTIKPITHANSTIGDSTTPYEDIHVTNIHGTTANISNITGELTGNASSATVLQTTRKINGTDFNGSTAIITNQWGTARNISISDASASNTSSPVSVNGSGNVTLKLPTTIKADLVGNASSAIVLKTARNINGTSFNGSADITTNIWGTARNIAISDATAANTGTTVSVNGSSNVSLRLPATIKAELAGNSATTTKLKTARSINNTTFDGSADIITNRWGVDRSISISDSNNTHTGAAVTVNGSNNVVLKLPATISAALSGNATTATTLQTTRTINGTNFNGSANITTAYWGTARNISIADSSGSNTGTAISVNGSGNVTLRLPGTINANLVGNVTGNCSGSSGSCTGNSATATTAGAVSTSVAAGNTKDLVYARMADNDYCWIRCGGASDAGYLEIATGDNGNDPIYVRQNNNMNGSVRTLTLLDGNGNTQLPGTVTAPTFSGNLNGNAATATNSKLLATYADDGHFLCPDRYDGWNTRLYMTYGDKSQKADSIHVHYADYASRSSGNGGFYISNYLVTIE